MTKNLKKKLQTDEDIGRGIIESKRKVNTEKEMESWEGRHRERPTKKEKAVR